MKSYLVSLICLLALTGLSNASYCKLSQKCWPSDSDVDTLYNELDPSINRTLYWENYTLPSGVLNPYVLSVPYGSSEPLYGEGVNMKPVYKRSDYNVQDTCFTTVQTINNVFCRLAVRNTPQESWNPGFIVWPTNVTQVQAAVRFAVKHNLCVMVAGTGHDFMNRHSCQDGLFIRTALMKNISFDNDDERGFGWADGNVEFGAGIVFAEAHYAAAQQGRYVSSGWASTVGIIGWSIGGGHGPFAPSKGLGVDNILQIGIVLANGTYVVANANQSTDLFWALRGGGGSTWGVITSIVVRTHKIPSGGLSVAKVLWYGSLCGDTTQLESIIQKHQNWTQTLDSKWGGLTFMGATESSYVSCGVGWYISSQYAYTGSKNETDFQEKIADYQSVSTPKYTDFQTYNNWYEFLQTDLEQIYPTGVMNPSSTYVGGVPSVLIQRSRVESGEVADYLINRIKNATNPNQLNPYSRFELYQCITGQLGSPQDPNVSIHPDFRTAMFHTVVGAESQDQMREIYKLGNTSYFSESAYALTQDYASWYWGQNAAKLQQIKKSLDPNNVFACRHCIGYDDTKEEKAKQSFWSQIRQFFSS